MGAEKITTDGANAATVKPHEARATDPIRSGKEQVGHAGFNAGSPANLFEQRVSQGGTSH